MASVAVGKGPPQGRGLAYSSTVLGAEEAGGLQAQSYPVTAALKPPGLSGLSQPEQGQDARTTGTMSLGIFQQPLGLSPSKAPICH